MELIFVILIGLVVGLFARYGMPGRDSYGVVLQFSLGAGVASLSWVALAAAGLDPKRPLIWVVVTALTIACCVLTARALRIQRSRQNERRFAELLKTF